MIEKSVFADAQSLWNYLVLHEPVVSADLLLVLGSVDERVAVYAAELSRSHSYDAVVFSGGVAHAGDLLQTSWPESEAEHFYTVFKKSGGVAKKVLLETKAENTGQNAILTYELLMSHGLPIPKTVQVVTKPYMLRRARATFDVQWPAKQTRFFFSASQLSFDDYVANEPSPEALINIMVGDFERIVQYPKRGLQSEQVVPIDVINTWHRLVEKGYTRHRIV